MWEHLWTQEFALRCGISGTIAVVLYLTFAIVVHHYFERKVKRDIYAFTLTSDIVLGITSVVFGSPMLQFYGVAQEKYGVSQLYTSIEQYGYVYWALSIPAYLLLWDLVFYILHLVLHTELLYKYSHANHHAFRPPVAWSGIAIDPIETIFSGILPYVVPLFILPFHMYTVYTLNILLVGWATLLHSSCPWTWWGPFSWLMVRPRDHNRHHECGLNNAKNLGAIFTLWDRMGGTLDRVKLAAWIAEEDRARLKGTTAGTKAERKAADLVEPPVRLHRELK